MGTFAVTANVDYHLSFADQGKQTYVFRIYIFWKVAHTWIYIYIYLYLYIYIYIHISISIYLFLHLYRYTYIQYMLLFQNRKLKTEVCCWSVYLRRNKRKLQYLFANGLNGLAYPWGYATPRWLPRSGKYTRTDRQWRGNVTQMRTWYY
jgi:hypothetical protein